MAAYMRGDPYVYDSGDAIHIRANGRDVWLKTATFDALALMRLAELLKNEEAFKAAVAQVERCAGNFGASDFMELIGGPSAQDWLRKLVTENTGNRREDYEVCETCGTYLRPKKVE